MDKKFKLNYRNYYLLCTIHVHNKESWTISSPFNKSYETYTEFTDIVKSIESFKMSVDNVYSLIDNSYHTLSDAASEGMKGCKAMWEVVNREDEEN